MTTQLVSSGGDVLAARLVEQLTDLLQAGGDAEEFIAAHSEQEAMLRRLLPAVRMMADLSRSGEPGASAPGDLPLGELGDFRLIREVGRGGMGIVYEAEQISLRRRVALKVLPFAATMDPRHLQRFHNEALAAASLHHEHIAPVHGVGCERGVHYYAMQFIDGHTLADVILASRERQRSEEVTAANPPVAHASDSSVRDTALIAALTTERIGPRGRVFFRRIAALVADAADALEHAHSVGIVHRDVKPGNLMVDAAGKLWVTDFGLARFGPDGGLTMSGDLLGTLRYMAPEQALAKHGLIDHRADVYGLGATLYELLTGRPAVGGEDKHKVLRRIAFEEPVAVRRVDRSIPAELETITLKCLAKEPGYRYATAGELANDLRRFLDDKPVQAKPPTIAQRLAKLARRHRGVLRTAVGMLGLALVILAAATVIVVGQRDEVRTALGQARSSLATAEAERERARRVIDDMYTQVAEKWLAHQPRLQPIQREFLQKALRHYQDFARDDAANPGARLAAGRAYLRVGTIQVKLGAYPEAEQAYRQCVAIGQEAAADAEGRSLLGAAWQGLGAVLHRAGRDAEAGEVCRQAVAALRRTAEDMTSTPADQSRLADAYSTLGQTLENPASLPAAEDAYREALTIRERLTSLAPAEPEYRALLAETIQNLGRLHYLGQHFEQAGTAFERAVALGERLVKEYPRESGYQERLARYYLSASVLWWKIGQPAKAEPALRRAVEVQARLADDFPDVPAYREELALSWNMLGNVSLDLGRPADAVTAYRRAVEIKEKLVAEVSAVPAYRQDVVQALNNLTKTLTGLHRVPEAEQANAQARRHAEQLVKNFPADKAYGKDLARTHQRRADIRLAAGDAGGAAAAWRQALAASDHPDIRDGVAFFLADGPDPRQRDPARAVGLAEANVRTAQENAGYWEMLGLALYRADRAREAVPALEKGRQLLFGRDAVSARLLIVLAMARWQAGDKDEARRVYAVAKELFEKTDGSDENVGRLLAEAAVLLGLPDGTKAADTPPR